MTPDAALAELLDVSDRLRSIALFDAEGAVLAEIGGRSLRQAASVWCLSGDQLTQGR